MLVDPIARTIYCIIFLLLLGSLAYSGIRILMLSIEVRDLKTTVVELNQKLDSCKSESAVLDDANSFLRQNIERLNAYYRRKPKPPVVSNGVFNKDNLFPVEPR